LRMSIESSFPMNALLLDNSSRTSNVKGNHPVSISLL
jgi:hypothetical protein